MRNRNRPGPAGPRPTKEELKKDAILLALFGLFIFSFGMGITFLAKKCGG